MAAIKVNQGTQTTIQTVAVGGTETQVVRLDIGSGATAAEFGGTISRVTELLKGTVTAVAGGTIQNLNFGTVDTFYRHPDAFATVVSTGTNTLGTIKAAVSGSSIYVTDLIVSAGSATNVVIASGGTSTPILGTLHLAANGGAVMNFKSPIYTASGSALVYKQSTAVSPISITAVGYVD